MTEQQHEHLKTLYVGNYTIDIAIKEGVRVDSDTNKVFIPVKNGTAEGSEVELQEDADRIITTDKNDAEKDLSFLLGKVPLAKEKLGGGGRNSMDEHRFHESTGSNCMHLDMQVPLPQMKSYLEQHNIEGYFLNKRWPAVNVVLAVPRNGGTDKRIIKSPIQRDLPLTPHEERSIEDLVERSDRIVMNSVKDEPLARAIMRYSQQYKKDIGVVVTTSFSNYDFVKQEIIPNAVCIFNYDEIGTVFNPDHKALGDEEKRIDDALWGMGDAIHIQQQRGNGRKPIYVTLGRNGVLGATPHGVVYQIKLRNRKIQDSLKDIVDRREDATNGAGDHFASAVLRYVAERYETTTAAVKAQIDAVRYLGFEGEIKPSDFIIEPIDAERLERKFIWR